MEACGEDAKHVFLARMQCTGWKQDVKTQIVQVEVGCYDYKYWFSREKVFKCRLLPGLCEGLTGN